MRYLLLLLVACGGTPEADTMQHLDGTCTPARLRCDHDGVTIWACTTSGRDESVEGYCFPGTTCSASSCDGGLEAGPGIYCCRP